MPANGTKNLKPMNKLTEEEQKKLASKGGKASGKARRAKKTAKECAKIFLELPVSDLRKWKKLARDGVDPKDIDNMMLMVAGIVRAAQDGDVIAFRELLKLIGEDGAVISSSSEDDPITKAIKEEFKNGDIK